MMRKQGGARHKTSHMSTHILLSAAEIKHKPHESNAATHASVSGKYERWHTTARQLHPLTASFCVKVHAEKVPLELLYRVTAPPYKYSRVSKTNTSHKSNAATHASVLDEVTK